MLVPMYKKKKPDRMVIFLYGPKSVCWSVWVGLNLFLQPTTRGLQTTAIAFAITQTCYAKACEQNGDLFT